MPQPNQVKIRLISRQDGEEVTQELTGEAFIKGNSVYIRYEESDINPEGDKTDRPVTRTTVKIGTQQLKIMRHGAVQSEQSFELDRRLPGFYRSPYTQFQMSAHTRKLEVEMNGHVGQVNWEYDMYVLDELTGRFAISILIQEEPKS
ncbi:DUF1934 domain-containing protein [Paenibacillus sediminis]|uniref:Uncharacterized beta-barrel protein YwiB (DUF1934 family) n=1 Tax=Paenibacillus sediminis TaxID=664909 RepID=A0ABS4H7V6_9BACL|nr:DUF1934 domain-containing protein [Paenibacillus sediminis]MBP1938604.1 uncharacterized beta-barrel protein YwiB (DUF1934 family) [Paenibacillus sediminis]